MPGVTYKISGDNSQFKSDVQQSESIAKGGFDKISALGIAAWAAIGAMVIKVTSAGVNFLKDSVNVGMGFDQSMSQVAATMGTTVDNIQDLTSFAMEMGATTAFSAQQAADGLNILAQSGLTAQEQMATLPEVLNLAASGGLDLATSAKYVTGAVKGFGDSFDNASKYTDMIAVGAAQANTNVNQLGLALSDSAATASSYGQTAEGTTLALLRLAEQNVTGAEAATALNRAMMDLYTPTSGAQKALDELGVSAYDLATGKARPLNDVIDELNASMDGLTDAEKNQYKNAIFSTFGLQAFNKMVVSSSDKVDKFEGALSTATGAAKKMAETQLDNLAGDITLAKSASESFKITISNALTPAIRSFVQKGTSELGKLKNAFETGGWGGLGKQFATSLSEMLSEIGKSVPSIASAALEFGKTFMTHVGQSLSANTGVFISKAAELLSKFGQHLSDNAPEIGKRLGNALANAISAAPLLIKSAVEFIGNFGKAIISSLPEIAKSIASGLGDVITGAVSSDVINAKAELQKLKDEYDDVRKAMDVTDTIDQIDSKYKLAEGWIATYERLSGKTNLTKSEQLELNAAIEGLNSLLPEGQKIVDGETDSWNSCTEAIKLNIAAAKSRAKATAYLNAAQTALEAMVKAEIDLQTHSDLATQYKANAAGMRKTLREVEKARDTVYDFAEGVRSRGEIIMAQDLPAPARALAEQWGYTGQLTEDQLNRIGTALEDQRTELEKNIKTTEELGDTHEQAAIEAQKALDDTKKAYELAQDAADNLLSDAATLEAEGAAAGKAYADAIAKQEEAVRQSAIHLRNVARSGVALDLYGEGLNAAKGLASGLSAGVGSVSVAAQGLASAARLGVTSKLMIKSPSRVMMEVGEFATEGFALGIKSPDGLDNVKESSEKVADASLYGLSNLDLGASPVVGTENTKIDTIVTLLTTYLPNVGSDIVLDTGELVGHTIGKTDRELGILQMRRARYE